MEILFDPTFYWVLSEPHWMVIICAPKGTNESVEKQASQRLMENVHPAGFAAGRNPEESGVHRSTPQ
jgi:hypothetical protein